MWQLYREESLLLHSGTVHLWLAKLSVKDNELSVYKKILSKNELSHADKFFKEENSIYYVVSKAITRQILSRYLDISPEKIEFSVEKNGKPFVNGGDLQFNVSHSDDYFLMGITKNNLIGVDIERARKKLDYLALAKRFFAPKEYEAMEMLSGEKQIGTFYRCWTRKEAFIKATGLGLSFGLNNFEVSLSDEPVSALISIHGDHAIAKKWTVTSIKTDYVDESYFAAIAVQRKIDQIVYYDYVHSWRS